MRTDLCVVSFHGALCFVIFLRFDILMRVQMYGRKVCVCVCVKHVCVGGKPGHVCLCVSTLYCILLPLHLSPPCADLRICLRLVTRPHLLIDFSISFNQLHHLSPICCHISVSLISPLLKLTAQAAHCRLLLQWSPVIKITGKSSWASQTKPLMSQCRLRIF